MGVQWRKPINQRPDFNSKKDKLKMILFVNSKHKEYEKV